LREGGLYCLALQFNCEPDSLILALKCGLSTEDLVLREYHQDFSSTVVLPKRLDLGIGRCEIAGPGVVAERESGFVHSPEFLWFRQLDVAYVVCSHVAEGLDDWEFSEGNGEVEPGSKRCLGAKVAGYESVVFYHFEAHF